MQSVERLLEVLTVGDVVGVEAETVGERRVRVDALGDLKADSGLKSDDLEGSVVGLG